MKIIKIDEMYAIDVKEIIREAYLPLLEKYHDEKENPANKTIDNIIYDLKRDNSEAYLLLKGEEKIGYVRVGERDKGEYSIADLAIRPEYQGNGYAQHFIREIEKLYPMAEKWSLVTIMEEEKDCYLYEKLGYEQKCILEEVNEGMHFVLYVNYIKERINS